ncbi:hypothetical protein O3Q52_01685 [Streptomyces sp. ActVer]|uniref:hypothetical protein n=1 Tax=Streptomyces sp. ActVer TaxID=3014558 RepID=UPI0022B2E6B1|nr:hypothetical protein [Streptomyces sp. ActVer]MCZ4506939.1 hypothetical protein [Streptomyces sp. ActVer]
MSDSPQPLPDADLLAWSVVLEYRAQQQRDRIAILLLPFPPCPTCGETVLSVESSRSFQRDLDSQRLIMRPCEHVYAVTDDDIQRVQGHAGDMLSAMRAVDNGWGGERAWTTAEVAQQAEARIGKPAPVGSDPGVDRQAVVVLSALHRSAESDVSRVSALYERWVKAGPPPLGTSLSRWWDRRLIELHDAINPTEEKPR